MRTKNFYIYFYRVYLQRFYQQRFCFFHFYNFVSNWEYCYKHFTIMCILFRYPVFLKSGMCRQPLGFLSKTSPFVTIRQLKLTERLRSYYYKVKEMYKTSSVDQHFMRQWTNIRRWVIVPLLLLPLQLLQDGITVHLFKIV